MSNVFTVDLPPNKGYKCRRATFARVTDGNTPVAGILEVREWKDEEAADRGAKPTVRRYAVQEREYAGGRRFRLRKPLEAHTGPDTYVCLRTGGQHDECTCEWFQAGCKTGLCVHVQALRALYNAGHLATSFLAFPVAKIGAN